MEEEKKEGYFPKSIMNDKHKELKRKTDSVLKNRNSKNAGGHSNRSNGIDQLLDDVEHMQ